MVISRLGAVVIPVTLAAGLLSGGAGCENRITDADIRFVRVAEVRELSQRQSRSPEGRVAVFIDPRAARHFDAGRLPGARNLKLPQVPERSSPDPAIAGYSHIVVYGDNPASAAAKAMTKRMMSVGYKKVRLFAGGVAEWLEAGYPVEKSGGEPAEPGDIQDQDE